ncbi:hypothetical protein NE237_012701 [Protea cynaroides]|uniref:Uncharacterized protein n=1 Tax=Protea cynaroides TaxID=273540 RepID=A0A9Q0GXZ3_9MAGN|nr:hypothetical protein NE237_012701 [Protea cynaroides]
MVTPGATSNTSAVTDSFPLRSSSTPCILTWKSFTLFIRNFNPFTTDSSVATIAEAEYLDVNIYLAFHLSSNKLDKSNPDDIDDINLKALKNGGEGFGKGLITAPSSAYGDSGGVDFSGDCSSINNGFSLENPFLNQGVCIISGIMIRFSGSATRSFEINRLVSVENHGRNSALNTLRYIFIMFSS